MLQEYLNDLTHQDELDGRRRRGSATHFVHKWMAENYLNHQFPSIRAVWYEMKTQAQLAYPQTSPKNLDKNINKAIGETLWSAYLELQDISVYGAISSSYRVDTTHLELPIVLFQEKQTLNIFQNLPRCLQFFRSVL